MHSEFQAPRLPRNTVMDVTNEIVMDRDDKALELWTYEQFVISQLADIPQKLSLGRIIPFSLPRVLVCRDVFFDIRVVPPSRHDGH